MRFHEKLDFLMSITATTNVQLSRKTNLDPSYISRLRRGERKPVKDRFVIETMASHFARNATLDYQLDLLSDMIFPDYRSAAEKERMIFLADWLCDQGVVISNQPFFTSKNEKSAKADRMAVMQSSSGIYYGFEGKRQATLRFLATIMKSRGTEPIMFFDDGNSAWLTDDGDFKLKVRRGLKAAVEKGHRIIIIHNINRPLNDMIKAIELWMPLHFSGMTEAYYYPKVRDDLFKRTICVVPDTVAVVSSSVGEESDNTANFFVLDPLSIKSFEEEFSQLLKRCVPLLEVYKAGDRRLFFNFMEEFSKAEGNNIYNLGSPSFVTMPAEVRNSIMSRAGKENPAFEKAHEEIKNIFTKRLPTEKYYEIINKKDAGELNDCGIMLPYAVYSHGYPIFYTDNEYIAHLENYIVLAEKYDNFHFVIHAGKRNSFLPLYLKEGVGAIMVNPDGGSVILRTRESSLLAALYDYSKYSTALGKYNHWDKRGQIEKMKEYIDEIRAQAADMQMNDRPREAK